LRLKAQAERNEGMAYTPYASEATALPWRRLSPEPYGYAHERKVRVPLSATT
jgi:hypothetical protein